MCEGARIGYKTSNHQRPSVSKQCLVITTMDWQEGNALTLHSPLCFYWYVSMHINRERAIQVSSFFQLFPLQESPERIMALHILIWHCFYIPSHLAGLGTSTGTMFQWQFGTWQGLGISLVTFWVASNWLCPLHHRRLKKKKCVDKEVL